MYLTQQTVCTAVETRLLCLFLLGSSARTCRNLDLCGVAVLLHLLIFAFLHHFLYLYLTKNWGDEVLHLALLYLFQHLIHQEDEERQIVTRIGNASARFE